MFRRKVSVLDSEGLLEWSCARNSTNDLISNDLAMRRTFEYHGFFAVT